MTYVQSFFYIFRSSGLKSIELGVYQDSSRSWIKHNGGEIIYDLNRPLVPKTWNTFCYSCWENGTFLIWVNGEYVKSGKYQQEMEDFELKSPILLGANSDNDEGNHRFFGEISNSMAVNKLFGNMDIGFSGHEAHNF